jgi:hypothetical protein
MRSKSKESDIEDRLLGDRASDAAPEGSIWGFEWHYRNKGGSSLREEVHSLRGDLGEEVHSV